MSDEHKPTQRLIELVSDLQLDGPTPEAVEELQALLATSESLRRLYVDLVNLDGLLGEAISADRAGTTAGTDHEDSSNTLLAALLELDQAAGEVAPVKLEPTPHRPAPRARAHPHGGLDESPRVIVIPRPLVWLAIAAGVVLAGGVLMALFQDGTPAVNSPGSGITEHEPATPTGPASPMVIAALVDARDAVWEGDARPGAADGTMGPGRYTLTQGAAQVKLARGASMILQAPCTIDLIDDNRAKLLRGGVVANVPAKATGFTIEAGQVRVVDLGTEFGVRVSETGQITTAVFEGEVVLRSQRPGTPTVSLLAGQSLIGNIAGHLGEAQPLTGSSAGPQFARTLDDAVLTRAQAYARLVLSDQPLVYWRFEGDLDAIDNQANPNKWRGRAVGQVELGQGVFGRAVALAGNDLEAGGISAAQPIDLSANQAFSFEAWCYPESQHRGILFDIAGMTPDDKWLVPHLAVVECIGGAVTQGKTPDFAAQRIRLLHRNPPSAEGLVGENAQSDTPYPVGRWTHVVAIKDQGKLKIYLDGQLVAEHDDPQTVNNDPSMYLHVGVSAAVMFANRPEVINQDQLRPFHGRIDEVAVYGRALTPDEVAAHFDAGNPNE